MIREKKEKYNEDLQNKEMHDHHIKDLTAFEKIILRMTKDKFQGRKEHVEAVENKNNNSNASEISSAARSVEMISNFKGSSSSSSSSEASDFASGFSSRNPMASRSSILHSDYSGGGALGQRYRYESSSSPSYGQTANKTITNPTTTITNPTTTITNPTNTTITNPTTTITNPTNTTNTRGFQAKAAAVNRDDAYLDDSDDDE